MNDKQIRQQWRDAKVNQLAEGYATQQDRRIAAEIRRRQSIQIPVTAAQVTFAEAVEACK